MNRSILLLLAIALTSAATAGNRDSAPPLTDADRQLLADIVVDTWAAHVDVEQLDRWMAHVRSRADSVPLPWLESAAAALDLRSVDLALNGLASLDTPTPAAFGSPGGNLVFTPLPPCRLLDTRMPSLLGDVIPANSQRAFNGFGVNFQSTQGGANSDCGLPESLQPEALAITLVAVNPAGDGFLTAYPIGTPQPLAASLNYTAGSIVSTGLILPINRLTSTLEFSIYTWQQTHVVADVTGYFARPQATPLDCSTFVGPTVTVGPFSVVSIESPLCPSTHTPQFGNCLTSHSGMALLTAELNSPNGRTRCVFENSRSESATARVGARCCRTPGR